MIGAGARVVVGSRHDGICNNERERGRQRARGSGTHVAPMHDTGCSPCANSGAPPLPPASKAYGITSRTRITRTQGASLAQTLPQRILTRSASSLRRSPSNCVVSDWWGSGTRCRLHCGANANPGPGPRQVAAATTCLPVVCLARVRNPCPKSVACGLTPFDPI